MTALSSCRTVFQNLRILVYLKPGTITSSEYLSTSSSSVSTVIPSPRTVFAEKFKRVMDWYEEVTGIREVRLSQEKVLKAEDRFITAQDARRDISKELSAVRDRLKDIYAELDQTSRGEDRYVLLITQEHKVLKDERRLADQFHRCEQEERENFSTLSSAVKESHEKERIQAERTKYWSIIGSIIGTMIGIGGSSINNEFKMRELRKLVKESAQATILSRQEAEVPKDLIMITDNVRELSLQLVQEQANILDTIKEQNSAMGKQLEQVQKFTDSQIYVTGDGVAFNIDQLLETQRKENRILAIVCLSSVVCIMFVTKILS